MQKYSIADIAKICGVSKATVSRVINNKSAGVGEETKQRVLKIINELNYRPNTLARSIATSASNMIGLVVPDVCNVFFPVQIRSICDFFSERGYSVFLCNSDFDPQKEKAHLLSMVDKRVEGVILCSGVANNSYLSEFKKFNIPIVLMGRTFDRHLCDASISSDNKTGATEAVSHLIATGNRRIAYIDGTPGVSGAIQRHSGYKAALKNAGIPYDASIVFNGTFTIEYGAFVTRELLENHPDVTAVFTGSDLIGIGVLKSLEKAGKSIPESFEVIGFDGIEISEVYSPKLSTVSKPRHEMAAQAAAMLLNIITGDIGSIRHITVQPNLLLRETTK